MCDVINLHNDCVKTAAGRFIQVIEELCQRARCICLPNCTDTELTRGQNAQDGNCMTKVHALTVSFISKSC